MAARRWRVNRGILILVNLRRHLYILLIWLLTIPSLHLIVYAQKDKGRAKVNLPCEGGVVNSNVIVESEPVYTDKAKRAKAEGNVIVRVRIDEEGRVYEAVACAGHLLLRQPSVDAAYQTRLSRTLVSGKAVKVAGVLLYVFKLDEEKGRLYKPQPAPDK